MSWYTGLPHAQALGDGGPRSRTQLVVIHATDNATASAADEAQYATHREDQTSAHFYVDEGEVWQGLDTTHIAFGCLWNGNQRSVQFELCGLSNHLTDATMRRAAPIVARVCAEFGIPIRKVSAAEVAAGVTGICGHADITAAFPQDGGDHTDPGSAFPWSTFISYVAGTGQRGDEDMALVLGKSPDGFIAVGDGVFYRVVRNGVEWSAIQQRYGITEVQFPSRDALLGVVGRVDAEALSAAIAAIRPGAPTSDQVNAAMVNALKDPGTVAALGAAVASHIKVT